MFSLGRVARTKPHLLADTAEIAIAFGGYEGISASDLSSIIKQSTRPDDELLDIDEPDVDDDDLPDHLDGAETTSREQAYVEECVRQIEFRVSAFGLCYPFVLDRGRLALRKELTYLNHVYLLLLACSRIRSFTSKGIKQRLADAFELICAECLRRLVPETGEVYMFGPNSNDRREVFHTNLSAAMPLLVEKLGIELTRDWEKNFGSSGDGKIDLVSVVRVDKLAPGVVVMVGQCAAMEEEKNWERKRQEAIFATRRGSFICLVDPQGILFIPVCYRQANGEWINKDYVSSVVTMDRLRIISVLSAHGKETINIQEIYKKVGLPMAA
ncbi:hypothetical protein LB515_27905 [Mesorhizobium sp. CA15]|uniref:hypothetical protein n=1 Tax=Mesorhizobium sp. CA15 TaxID=2876641 RepID=UPI001CD0C2BC|nr:hypothetical protein [Mesorhizobium sp. CA15]MBZ9869218.1 hypothetical protein [Mesorhizobium sp. CA15]